MNTRLLRALQRGGVAAQTQSDLWGVWRGKDRRGRKIGALNGCDVEILRVRGQLKALGDHDPPLLVWCGTVPAQGKAHSTLVALDEINVFLTLQACLDLVSEKRVTWFNHWLC